MSSSRGKKTAVPASKKRKEASSFEDPTTKIRHPLLQFLGRPQEELFQILQARPLIADCCIDWDAVEQVQLADSIRALLTTDPWELFFGIIKPIYLELTIELCSTFHLQTVIRNYNDPGTKCWHTLAPGAASYNPNRSKASVLPPSLRYLYAILAHTITGRRESTGVVNTHDAYFLWCMSHRHIIDLAYFIALTIQHQAEWHKKGGHLHRPLRDSTGATLRAPQHRPSPSSARCLHNAYRACLA
ncbi:hypothetical protein GOBAR_AA26766 [Gossypium barbadense]|uniref:Uncharacterized protein n=1 Tax=Gossypium barbadense TaxID=3634 RepID=A0A2P5WS78_GOSBA|nr:hypothetical protein GOBAR_AA26766 [Gossypium barbadense]